MGDSTQSRPHLRFAVISFLAFTIAVAILAYLGSEAAAERERKSAAREAAALVAAPMRPIFDPVDKSAPVAADVRNTVDPIANALLAGKLDGLRITADDDTVIYEAGARFLADPVQLSGGGVASTGGRAAEGAALFVTLADADGYIIEVAQDAGPISSAVNGARGQFVGAALAFALGVWLIAQGVFAFVSSPLIREHRRLANLYVTGEQIRSSMDLHDVLTQLVQDAASLGGGRYSLIALFDEATSEVVLRANFDRQANTVALLQRPIDDWFIRRCVATNSTIVSSIAEGTARSFLGTDALIEGDTPLLCTPMSLAERVVGAIAVIGTTSGRGGFAPSDVQLLEQLSAQAVTAVEQSLLLTRVRTDAKELEASYDSTLKALMAALDAKDESTEGHCERVAKLTVQLARHMELPEAMMVHIERGAMLHDVGKIGVPDEVLQKPESLSENEWTTMRKHPMLAGLMVSKVGFLEPAMPILLYHHERFDGGGYPFGLAGANIPIEARIFTIVDAYDAMTQDRPYRQAMSHIEAMDEIRAHNGSQFDPQVVDGFESMMATRPDLRATLAASRVLNTDDIAHWLHDADDHEHVA